MNDPSGAARIRQIEARAAIADLVHAYARAVRRDRPEDVEALFVPGGTFELREGKPDQDDYVVRTHFESPQALLAFLIKGKGGPHPVPLIHNLMIEVHDDTASASSLMIGPILGTVRRVFGEYADRFACAGDEWRFASRVFTLFREDD